MNSHRTKTVSLAVALVVAGSMTMAAAPPSRTSPGTPVPPVFRAQSQSWTDAAHGWLVGKSPCGDDVCTTLARTVNSGKKWSVVGTLPVKLSTPQTNGIDTIRFADKHVGFAFGPSLYSTADAGWHWDKLPLPGNARQVKALAVTPAHVYMLTTACKRVDDTDCSAATKLYSAKLTSAKPSWHPESAALPAQPFESAELAAAGKTVYVGAAGDEPGHDVLYSGRAGGHWNKLTMPCKASEYQRLTDVAAATSTRMSVLCLGDAGHSKSGKYAFRSDDGGRSFTSAGDGPEFGIVTHLAEAAGGQLAMASTSSGSWLYSNTGGKKWATSWSNDTDGGADWHDPMFVSNHVGYVIYSPAGSPPGDGMLMRTRDTGQTWKTVVVGQAGAPA